MTARCGRPDRNFQPCSETSSLYLTETEKFFEECGFKISVNKTVAILFSRSTHIPTDVILKINDVMIKFEKTVKFLGVIFDRALNGQHTSTTSSTDTKFD